MFSRADGRTDEAAAAPEIGGFCVRRRPSPDPAPEEEVDRLRRRLDRLVHRLCMTLVGGDDWNFGCDPLKPAKERYTACTTV